METVEDIVIVGAGIAGLATALGLHRLGIPSLVLESSERLRNTGFTLTTFDNAWKALDALGIGDSLREKHLRLHGLTSTSMVSGKINTELLFKEHEIRCLKRRLLMEALEKELPKSTVRYSSKVVSIQESGHFKQIHLADGAILKTKVLVGCDGVNSVVAKWLGLGTPVFTGRSAIRAYAEIKDGHGFGAEFSQFVGDGVRSTFLTCDDHTVYWIMTWSPTSQGEELEENPAKLKQFALNMLENLPTRLKEVIKNTPTDNIISSPLRYRRPWEMIWGNISKGNVCLVGDALHPMTPDLGQGGCSALEEGVILARHLAKALSKPGQEKPGREEWNRLETEVAQYARERRWRSFELIAAAYITGAMQQGRGIIMNFIRDKILAKFLAGLLLGMADFDCGKLYLNDS